MDATLQGHLGRSAFSGFLRPRHDLGDTHQVWIAAEIQAAWTLGEGAEAAAEVADVGVVDVAVDDVGDVVPNRTPPELIGGPGNGVDLVTPSLEEPHELVAGRQLTDERAFEDGPEVARSFELTRWPALDPRPIEPLCGEPLGRHGWRLVTARGPGGAGPGGAETVDLIAPRHEQRLVQSLPNLVDPDANRKSSSFDQPMRSHRAPELAETFCVPVPEQQVVRTRRNRRSGLLDVVDEDRHPHVVEAGKPHPPDEIGQR